MKPILPPLAAYLTLAGACLVWIGGVSLALVYFLELSNTTGWIIAGVLGVSMTVAVSVIIHEMRHAIDLTGFVDPSEMDELPPPEQWSKPCHLKAASRVPVLG
jgi:hypothetical protein